MNSFRRSFGVWRARDRFRPVRNWLDVRNKKILDAGCGVCGLETMSGLSENNEVHGIDLDPKSGDRRIKLKRHDLEKGLPYPDSYFDVVVTLDVIEHLHNYRFFLREIKRVLKDGGMLVISTANRNSIEGILSRSALFLRRKKWVAWDDTHKYIFSYDEFTTLLEKDFTIEKSIGLFFLWSKLEAVSFGPLIRILKLLRRGTDKLFSGNMLFKVLGFDIVVKCRKKA